MKHWRSVGWIGDPANDIQPVAFTDADYGGNGPTTQACTSGVFCCLRGPNSSFPISAQSKKQGCQSTSTTEAELTAAQLGIQRQGLPALLFWRAVCEVLRTDFAGLGVLLDNAAMIEILRTGRNLTIRHTSKTHGVAISWLHEVFMDKEVRMRYITTTLVAADLYTKAFSNRVLWEALCLQNNLFPLGPSAEGWPNVDSYLLVHRRVYELLHEGGGEGKQSVNDRQLMPPGLEHLGASYGWQTLPTMKLCVVREPGVF